MLEPTDYDSETDYIEQESFWNGAYGSESYAKCRRNSMLSEWSYVYDFTCLVAVVRNDNSIRSLKFQFALRVADHFSIYLCNTIQEATLLPV